MNCPEERARHGNGKACVEAIRDIQNDRMPAFLTAEKEFVHELVLFKLELSRDDCLRRRKDHNNALVEEKKLKFSHWVKAADDYLALMNVYEDRTHTYEFRREKTYVGLQAIVYMVQNQMGIHV